MTYLIAICNIAEKFILSGSINQVDLPGKVTEHREKTRKKDKVYMYLKIEQQKKTKTKQKNPIKKWTRKLVFMYLFPG